MFKHLHRVVQGLQFRILFIFFLLIGFVFATLFYSFWVQSQKATATYINELTFSVQNIAQQQELRFKSAASLLTALSKTSEVRRADACAPFLSELAQTYPQHTVFGVADVEGNVTCFSRTLANSLNIQDRSYFQQALSTKAFAVSDLIVGRVSGMPTMVLAQPLLDGQDNVEAVLFTGLDLAWLNETLQTVSILPDAVLSLIDEQGTLLARVPQEMSAVGSRVDPAFLAALNGADGTLFAYDGLERAEVGETYLVASSLTAANARFVLTLSEELAYAPEKRLLSRLTALILILAALTLGAGYYTLHRLVLAPTHLLLNATEQIQKGNLGLQASLRMARFGGEVGRLAIQFILMADRLNERQRAVKRAEADLKAANLKLKEETLRDPLTNLYNRRYLEETLQREIAKAERAQSPLAVAMVDVDHFKHFNDTYGHAAGDEVLKAVGQLFKSNLRAEDMACRYGGEEFTLVLNGISHELAQKRLEELRQRVSRLAVYHQGKLLEGVTISLGLAYLQESSGSVSSLINLADKALYEAKAQGRNQLMLA